MAARELGGLAVLVLSLGCAATPAAETAPQRPSAAVAPAPAAAPQTVTPLSPSPPSEEPVALPTPAPESREVVIDQGGGGSGAGQGLAAAARAERQRRQGSEPPMLVIDDKNLGQHATGGLTIARETPATETAGPVDDGPDEQRWRQRVRTLREAWALAVDSIEDLEGRAASLRTRFYAADDPYVRDGEIKPAWDHALENLAAARLRARELEMELQATLEEGQREGALPGWLRDGLELEPTEFPYERPDRREPVEGELSGEPVIVDEGGSPQ